MRFIATGSAGFIGFHLKQRLLADGHIVVGFDGTFYNDRWLKQAHHAFHSQSNRFTPIIARLEDIVVLEAVADLAQPDDIVHQEARAKLRAMTLRGSDPEIDSV